MTNPFSLDIMYWVVYGLVVALPIMVLTVTKAFKEDVTVLGFIFLTIISMMPGSGFVISVVIVFMYVFKLILDIPFMSKVLFKKGKK